MGMKWVKNIPIFRFQIIEFEAHPVDDQASRQQKSAGLKRRGFFSKRFILHFWDIVDGLGKVDPETTYHFG